MGNFRSDNNHNWRDGWFQFKGSAGTGLARSEPSGHYNCMTRSQGWLSTELPSEDNVQIPGVVCFKPMWDVANDNDGGKCGFNVDIRIVKCSGITYYWLVRPPGFGPRKLTLQRAYCGQ